MYNYNYGNADYKKFKIGDKVRFKNGSDYIIGEISYVLDKDVWNQQNYEVTYHNKRFNKICLEADLELYRPEKNRCECGAVKTYGSSITKAHHAHWCPERI